MAGLEQREVVAYAIVAALALVGTVAWLVSRKRRRLRKLRRKGVKTYGH